MKWLLRFVLFGLVGFCCRADESPSSADLKLRVVNIEQGTRKIALNFIIFSEAHFGLRVIDNAAEDNTARFSNLAEAMEAHACVAGCNGGFFERRPFSPVGGMISAGVRVTAVDPKSWMKGLLVVRGGHPALEFSETFRDAPDVTELLQSGTWLVRGGKSETDSSRNQVARRTFVCHDGKGVWAIGASGPCTLHDLATVLKHAEVATILDIQEALNFDGGPSTGLWLKRTPDNFYLPEKWAVRNYIGVSQHSSP
ncbi:MAG: phosphodiester glycosidase family protein [Nibricoccus sp.]